MISSRILWCLRAAVLVVLFLVEVSAKAQCPPAIPGMPDSVCMGDPILFQLPSGASDAQWDMCTGDLSNDFTVSTSSTLTSGLATPRSISVVNDSGTWRGFVVNTSLSNLFRLDYDNGIEAAPTAITQIQFNGSSGSIGSNTWSRIQFYQEAGVWYGIGVTAANVIARLRFPTAQGLTGDTVDLDIISNTFGLGNAMDMDLVTKNDSLFMVIANNVSSELKVLTFGNSILNAPTLLATHSLPGFATPQSVDVTYHCGSYYGMVSSLSDGKVGLLEFGNSLTQLIAVNEVNSTANFPLPMKVFLEREEGRWIGVVKNRNNNIELSRIYINSSFSATPDSVVQVGAVNGHLIGWAFDFVREGSKLYGLGVDIVSNRRTYLVTFEEECSNAMDPLVYDYPDSVAVLTASGSYGVEMSFTNASGQSSTVYAPLWVKEGSNINLQLDEACAGDSLVLTDLSTSNAGILSRNWTIPGVGTFMDSVVEFQSIGADTIAFQFQVDNSEGCTDVLDSFIIAHPFPQLSIAVDSTCRGQVLGVTNTSTISFDSIASWSWLFNGLDTASAFTPNYEPLDSGVLSIQVSATSDFGCVTTDSLEGYVKDAPIAALEVEQTCFGSATQFVNLSTSTSPFQTFWELGDGTTSTAMSFNHVYPDTGDYLLELFVTAQNGCADTLTNLLDVANTPDIQTFGFPEVRCSAQEIPVQQVIVSDQIDEVLWFADGFLIDSLLDGTLTIPEPGPIEIRLIVNAGTSCFDTLDRTINFNLTPPFDVNINNECSGEPSLLISDISQANSSITSTQWSISVNDTVSADSLVFLEESVGEYPIWHSIETDSGCFADTLILLRKVNRPSLALNIGGVQWCTDSILPVEVTVETDSIDDLNQSWLIIGSGGSSDSLSIGTSSLNFMNEGIRQVKVASVTDAGCRDSLIQNLVVNPSPVFQLDSDTTCVFTSHPFDASYSGSNYAFLWKFGDEQESNDEAPNHVFTMEGTYRGSLLIEDRLTECFSRQPLSTVVLSPPTLTLAQDSFCVNGAVVLEAEVEDAFQRIEQLTWANNTTSFENLNPLILPSPDEGAYSISLSATTQFGCAAQREMIYSVLPEPALDLNIDQTFGAVPAEPVLSLSDTVAGIRYGFTVNGDTNFGSSLSIPITTPSVIEGTAFGINSVGCTSTEIFRLNFNNPLADLGIDGVRRDVDGFGSTTIEAQVVNAGTAPITSYQLLLSVPPEYRRSKIINDVLEPGELVIASFDGLIFQNQPQAYCVEVVTVNGAPDTVLANNERCLDGNQTPILSVYPNPASEEIEVILNGVSCNMGELIVIDELGGAVYWTELDQASSGAFKKTIDLRNLRSGVYIIAAYCDDEVEFQRFVKY